MTEKTIIEKIQDNFNINLIFLAFMFIFLCSFLALFTYFSLFPVQASEATTTIQETKIAMDPLAFEALKVWNNLNPQETEIQLDSCNKAQRIGPGEWKITLNNC